MTDVRELRKALNGNQQVDLARFDPIVCAAVLKLFLREMPEPLVPFDRYAELIEIARRTADHAQKLQALYGAVHALPPCNVATLACLARLLASVAAHADTNRMPSPNLAVCIAPNILYSADASSMLFETKQQHEIVTLLIDYHDYFFAVAC